MPPTTLGTCWVCCWHGEPRGSGAGRRPGAVPTGWGRSSILASLINAVVLLVAAGAIAVEAIRRLTHPIAVAEQIMGWVALAGIVINGASALPFMRGRGADLNVRPAFVHLAADAAVSFGVVLAAALIWLTGWLWIDRVTSLLIVATLTVTSWGLLRDSMALAWIKFRRALRRTMSNHFCSDNLASLKFMISGSGG